MNAVSLVLVFFIVGCAAHRGPIIDTQGVDMNAYQTDLSECERYADQVKSTQGVAKGAALGAVVGGVLGAISGSWGEGAAAGAVVAGAQSGVKNEETKDNIVKKCLIGRGYKILN